MFDILRLLSTLIAMFSHGPVAANLRDHPAMHCGAPPMQEVFSDMQEAATQRGVPLSAMVSTCLIESGYNPCGSFCGVTTDVQKWLCGHGVDCEVDYSQPPRRVALQQQFRVTAHLLARQHRGARNASWVYAIQGFHLGNQPQHLRPCPPSHRHGTRHHGVYALIALSYARRIEESVGVAEIGETEEVLWADSQRRAHLARR